jgi:hypothetical protein
MAVFDITGDGRPEILAGNDTGQLIALDGVTHDVVYNKESGSTDPIPGLKAFQPPLESTAKIVYTQSGQLKIFDIDSEATIFQSSVLGTVAGAGNGLALKHRTDGVFEVLVGTDYSLYQFTIPDGTVIFRQSFE